MDRVLETSPCGWLTRVSWNLTAAEHDPTTVRESCPRQAESSGLGEHPKRSMPSIEGPELKELTRRLVAFVWLTLLSFGIHLGATMLLHEVQNASEELPYAISLMLVFVINFGISRRVIFASTSGDPLRQVVLFGVSTPAFPGLGYLLFLLFHAVLGFWYLGVIIGVSIPMVPAKFLFLRKFVFVSKAVPEHDSDVEPN